jgi:hypothetical protein
MTWKTEIGIVNKTKERRSEGRKTDSREKHMHGHGRHEERR